MLDQGIEKLGPFPILQISGAILVLAALAIAIYKGSRDRRISSDQQPQTPINRWYFDGPLNAALETLRDIYRVMSNIDGQVDTFGELFRNQTHEIQELKAEVRELKNIMARRR
jgi:hypothetical protein